MQALGLAIKTAPFFFYTCAHAHVCVVSEGEMEPHGVFREVTALCTNKDHYQSVTDRGYSGERIRGKAGLLLKRNNKVKTRKSDEK